MSDDLDLDRSFVEFTNKIKPHLVMGELQVLAAFVEFLKSGSDVHMIPGNTPPGD